MKLIEILLTIEYENYHCVKGGASEPNKYDRRETLSHIRESDHSNN